MEDGGEIGGSRVHFPSTPVKYLADLRSRANSQQYSSIYEDWRPKIEESKDQTVRRVFKDNKVPGTRSGTTEATARVQGLLQDSWERARLGCVSSQVLVWTRGAYRKNFSKRKRKQRHLVAS